MTMINIFRGSVYHCQTESSYTYYICMQLSLLSDSREITTSYFSTDSILSPLQYFYCSSHLPRSCLFLPSPPGKKAFARISHCLGEVCRLEEMWFSALGSIRHILLSLINLLEISSFSFLIRKGLVRPQRVWLSSVWLCRAGDEAWSLWGQWFIYLGCLIADHRSLPWHQAFCTGWALFC